MPDPGFDALFEEAAKMSWQTTDEVRQRGQRRTNRARTGLVVAAFAAVLVLAGGAVAVTRWPLAGSVLPAATNSIPAPTPTPSPSPTTPSPTPTATAAPALVTKVNPSMMLQPADAGPGSWTDGLTSGDWKVEFTLSLCDNRPRDTVLSELDTLDIRLERTSDDASVQQTVGAYPAGQAANRFTELRTQISACAQFSGAFTDGNTITMTIIPVSSQAFVVKTEHTSGTSLLAVFWWNNLLSEIAVNPSDQISLTAMIDKALARMCPATAAC